MGKDKVLDLLEAADWNEIILKLTYYALWRVRRYTWRSGDSNQLSGGKTPEDITFGAIEKVWSGTREWDPGKYPNLLRHLMWIVDSDIEHLFSSMEHQKTGRMPTLDDGKEPEPSYGRTVTEPSLAIPDTAPTPEEELIAQEERRLEEDLKNELHKAVKGDEDLELLLLCFEEGIDKPKAIVAETGWDETKVNNLKKKLLRKAAKIGRTLDKNK